LSNIHGWSGTDPDEGGQPREYLRRDFGLFGTKNESIEQKNGSQWKQNNE
jgi:hypothetical protein